MISLISRFLPALNRSFVSGSSPPSTADRGLLSVRLRTVLDVRRRRDRGRLTVVLACVAIASFIFGIFSTRITGGVRAPEASQQEAADRPKEGNPSVAGPASARREFDAASIRINSRGLFARFACQGTDGIIETYLPSETLAKRMLQPSPVPRGRCIGEADLGSLIVLAHGIPADGGPDWVSTQRFEIQAIAPEPESVTTAELAQMLQTLIADRFRLRLRREPRETQGYALLTADSGPRFKEAAGQPELPRFELSNAERREGTIRGKSSMTELADFLAGFVSQGVTRTPVIDQTGLPGVYEYRMTFPLGGPGLRGGGSGMSSAIIDALEDQLGLRLEPRTLSGETLVIDRAERPSEN